MAQPRNVCERLSLYAESIYARPTTGSLQPLTSLFEQQRVPNRPGRQEGLEPKDGQLGETLIDTQLSVCFANGRFAAAARGCNCSQWYHGN